MQGTKSNPYITHDRISHLLQHLLHHIHLITGLLLLFGIIGLFFSIWHPFTILTLLLAIWLIPGVVIMTGAYPHPRSLNPALVLAGSVLISITTLTGYTLSCEILHISMTSSPGYATGPGLLFQLGIFLYTILCIFISALIRRTSKKTHNSNIIIKHEQIPSIRLVFVLLIIVAGLMLIAGVILMVDTSKPTTELYFEQNQFQPPEGKSDATFSDQIVIVNHEGKTTQYLLTIEKPDNTETSLPLTLTNGEIYREDLAGLLQSENKTARPALTAILYKSESPQEPYRTIWRRQNS